MNISFQDGRKVNLTKSQLELNLIDMKGISSEADYYRYLTESGKKLLYYSYFME